MATWETQRKTRYSKAENKLQAYASKLCPEDKFNKSLFIRSFANSGY